MVRQIRSENHWRRRKKVRNQHPRRATQSQLKRRARRRSVKKTKVSYQTWEVTCNDSKRFCSVTTTSTTIRRLTLPQRKSVILLSDPPNRPTIWAMCHPSIRQYLRRMRGTTERWKIFRLSLLSTTLAMLRWHHFQPTSAKFLLRRKN